MRRALLLLMLGPIAIDCIGCLLIGGSWRNTLSGEAWHQRSHKWTSWTHRMIDWLFFFQPNHCQIQAEREERHGSVWAAWLSDFK